MTAVFRNADPTNEGERIFIVSTWASSCKKSYDAGIIWTEDWASIMHPQIGRILDQPHARVVLAVDSEDPSFFYGWIAGDTTEATPIVYYVYVKEPYRRAGYRIGQRVGDGYARQLFAAFGVDPAAPFTYVCQTPAMIKLRDKIPRARRNPLEVRYPKENRRETRRTR